MWRNFGKCWMKNTRCFNHGDFGQLPPPFLLRLGLRFVLPWTFWVSLLSFVVDFICFSSLEGIRGLRIRWRQWKLHRVFAIHSYRAILWYGINEEEIDKSQGYIKANIKINHVRKGENARGAGDLWLRIGPESSPASARQPIRTRLQTLFWLHTSSKVSLTNASLVCNL